MDVFAANTHTPVSSTGQALALSHDGRGDFLLGKAELFGESR